MFIGPVLGALLLAIGALCWEREKSRKRKSCMNWLKENWFKFIILPLSLLSVFYWFVNDPSSDKVDSQPSTTELYQKSQVSPSTSRRSPQQGCHPSYSGCLKADASDYDCAGGRGNGPYYTGRVYIYGQDVFDLDRDGDGVGCE